LAFVYINENNPERFDNALQEYKTIVRLDPEQYEYYKKIADSFYEKAYFDSSIIYYNKYLDKIVDDSDALSSLAYMYTLQGKYKDAISTMEDAILLSNDILYYKKQTMYYKYIDKQINSIEYLNFLDKLLKDIDEFGDSTSIYYSYENYYYELGKIKKSVEYTERLKNMMHAHFGKMGTAKWLLQKRQIKSYIQAGLSDTVKTYLDYFTDIAVDPFDKTIAYKKCQYYLYMKDYDMLAATVDSAEKGYEEY
ncbi:uncharacterized protein METZ01_LOCUS315752, partial [marine metagenome]